MKTVRDTFGKHQRRVWPTLAASLLMMAAAGVQAKDKETVHPKTNAGGGHATATDGGAKGTMTKGGDAATVKSDRAAVGGKGRVDLDEVGIQESSAEWESITNDRETDLSDIVNVEDIVETTHDYRYAAFGAPDPFQPPDLSQIAGPESENEVVNGVEIPMLSSLQKYALDRLRIVGIWQLATGERRAMVMTPDAEGIIVKLNDPIAAGKVIDIQADRVVTRQYSIRTDGVRESSEIPMYIGKTPEGAIKGRIVLTPGKEPSFQEKKQNGVSGGGAAGVGSGPSLVPELPASFFSQPASGTSYVPDNEAKANNVAPLPKHLSRATEPDNNQVLPPPSAVPPPNVVPWPPPSRQETKATETAAPTQNSIPGGIVPGSGSVGQDLHQKPDGGVVNPSLPTSTVP